MHESKIVNTIIIDYQYFKMLKLKKKSISLYMFQLQMCFNNSKGKESFISMKNVTN